MDEDRWRTCLRWVVVHPHDPAVLLARRDGALTLPETERPGQIWMADPAEVLPALGELLGADALLLDCLDDHEDPAARVQGATLVAVPRQEPAPPPGTAWPPPTPPWPPRWSRRWSAAPAGTAASPGRPAAGSPRPRAGCARPWRASGRPVTGTVLQARVWRLSCVLRAPTGDGEVWFKANTTSPLFVNEGVVMGALAGLFPGRVPAPLAVEPERGWMVLDDFGQEVGWEAPLEVVEEVARAYARLQVTAAGHVGRLLDAGCLDRRLDRLAAQAWAWELAVPLGALHQAVSYRSLAAQPPGDPHMAQSTAWWLRQVLAGLG